MAEAHNNNFNLLRLLAALLVWYGHCYALTGAGDAGLGPRPYLAFTQLGVAIFFIISGYFVTLSYAHRASLVVYFKNRALRIMPALIAVILLCVFVLGPLITTLGLHAYFAESQTWKYLNSLLIFPLKYDLPGVFQTHPIHAVNGSLWTLKQEVRLYVIVGLLGCLTLLRPRVMGLLLVCLIGILLYGTLRHAPPEHMLGMKWGDLHIAVQLGSLFAAGSLLYLARESVPLNLKGFVLACALMVASIGMSLEFGNILFDMGLAYAVIYIGFLPLPLPGSGLGNDYSYGIYLYAFPMQQLTFELLGGSHFLRFMAISLCLTVACAIMSWFLVEKPALRLKH